MPTTRVSQAPLQVGVQGVGSAASAVTQVVTEVLFDTSPPPTDVHVTQIAIEVLFSNHIPPSPLANPQTPKLYFPVPNQFDCCLAAEEDYYRGFKRSLARIACPTIEDWDGRSLPSLGREFFIQRSIVTPTTISGDNTVLSFTLGPGYHGMIYGLVFAYTGTGFTNGSGDLLFRLQVGRAWARNLGAAQNTLGAPGSPFPMADYLDITQNQNVQVLVNVPNTSGLIQIGTSRIVCGVQGWTYPI